MSTLFIQLDADKAEDALVGFPFVSGQYIESEIENDGIVHVYIVSEEAFDDTTVAQEQFLNVSAGVLTYGVR